MKKVTIISILALSTSVLAAPTSTAVKDEEPIKVQQELRPPTQKYSQQTLEARVRDNLFKKEQKEKKEEAKKQ